MVQRGLLLKPTVEKRHGKRREACGVNEATPVEQKLLPRKIASLHDMVKEAMKEHSPERRYKTHARGWRVEGKKIRSVKQMRAAVSAGDNPYRASL